MIETHDQHNQRNLTSSTVLRMLEGEENENIYPVNERKMQSHHQVFIDRDTVLKINRRNPYHRRHRKDDFIWPPSSSQPVSHFLPLRFTIPDDVHKNTKFRPKSSGSSQDAFYENAFERNVKRKNVSFAQQTNFDNDNNDDRIHHKPQNQSSKSNNVFTMSNRQNFDNPKNFNKNYEWPPDYGINENMIMSSINRTYYIPETELKNIGIIEPKLRYFERAASNSPTRNRYYCDRKDDLKKLKRWKSNDYLEKMHKTNNDDVLSKINENNQNFSKLRPSLNSLRKTINDKNMQYLSENKFKNLTKNEEQHDNTTECLLKQQEKVENFCNGNSQQSNINNKIGNNDGTNNSETVKNNLDTDDIACGSTCEPDTQIHYERNTVSGTTMNKKPPLITQTSKIIRKSPSPSLEVIPSTTKNNACMNVQTKLKHDENLQSTKQSDIMSSNIEKVQEKSFKNVEENEDISFTEKVQDKKKYTFTDGEYIWRPYEDPCFKEEILLNDENNNNNSIKRTPTQYGDIESENKDDDNTLNIKSNADSINEKFIDNLKANNDTNPEQTENTTKDLWQIDDEYMKTDENTLNDNDAKHKKENSESYSIANNFPVFDSPLQAVIKANMLRRRRSSSSVLYNDISSFVPMSFPKQINFSPKISVVENSPIFEQILFDLYNLSTAFDTINDIKNNIMDITATDVSGNNIVGSELTPYTHENDDNQSRLIELPVVPNCNKNDYDNDHDNVNNNDNDDNIDQHAVNLNTIDDSPHSLCEESIGSLSETDYRSSASIIATEDEDTITTTKTTTTSTTKSVFPQVVDRIIQSKNILSGFLVTKQIQEDSLTKAEINLLECYPSTVTKDKNKNKRNVATFNDDEKENFDCCHQRNAHNNKVSSSSQLVPLKTLSPHLLLEENKIQNDGNHNTQNNGYFHHRPTFAQDSFNSNDNQQYYDASPNLYLCGHFEPTEGYRKVAWPPATDSVFIKSPTPQPQQQNQYYHPQASQQAQPNQQPYYSPSVVNNQQYSQYSQPEQQYYHPQAQQQPDYQQYNRGQSPAGVIQLRKEAPMTQEPAPIVQSQPAAAARYKVGGANLRGDLKWPPPEVKAQMIAENEERIRLAKSPAFRPRRVHKDYTQFFAQHALNSTYPGYKVPPGTQHIQC